MCSVRTGDQRLGGDTPDIDTRPAEPLAFDDGHLYARPGQRAGKAGARLARADHNGVIPGRYGRLLSVLPVSRSAERALALSDVAAAPEHGTPERNDSLTQTAGAWPSLGLEMESRAIISAHLGLRP